MLDYETYLFGLKLYTIATMKSICHNVMAGGWFIVYGLCLARRWFWKPWNHFFHVILIVIFPSKYIIHIENIIINFKKNLHIFILWIILAQTCLASVSNLNSVVFCYKRNRNFKKPPPWLDGDGREFKNAISWAEASTKGTLAVGIQGKWALPRLWRCHLLTWKRRITLG